MATMLAFRRPANRPADPETIEDYRDEVTAIRAEVLDLVAGARPIVAQLAVIGMNGSPAVRARADALSHLLDRAERRYAGSDAIAA